VKDLMNFYLDEKHIGSREFILDVGYVTAQRRLREASRAVFAGTIAGSAFGGEFAKLTPAMIAEKYTAHAKLAGAPAEASGKK
jgi:hypothetical protein